MGTLAELIGNLASDPVIRGRQFEHICKWFLETDPIYAHQLKRVWLWKDWPGRWGADAGIDLVAETTEGKLWAIQAKAYAPQYRIKKSDVDTFLSESSREFFSYRLLIATTNHIGATALRTLEAQPKSNPAHLSLLGDLERAPVEWPISPERLLGRPAKPKRPRPHQKRAIRDVLRGFEDHDRGQLIMACGTGKTLVGLWLAEAMQAQRTLVLLPSLSLLAQTLGAWRVNATRPFEALPVCSDETVRGEDFLVAHTSDLPFPVTTDADEIASFLRKRGPRVVFSTYQSSPKIAEARAAGRVPGFDLAIADEAHRVAGSVAKDFGTILDDRAIHAERRLFMTATPRYVKKWVRQRAEEADVEIASMDDAERFGPVLHRLTFGEAIDRELLSDYRVAIVGVDDETYRGYAERGTFVTTGNGDVTDARTLAAQIGLAKAMRKWDLRRILTFHSRVDWARRFSDSMPQVVSWMPVAQRPKGMLWGDHVSGAMPSGERDVRLDRLREVGIGERGVLSNARCLAEGVDVPTLDGVAFIDPRRSEVDVVQAVGRAIRKAEDKTTGTVVLPVFVGKGQDAEATVMTSAFDHVWQVLNALRSHDESLAEELDDLRRELGRRGSLGKRPGKIELLLPVGVDPSFARAFDARLVETTTSSWEFAFGRCLAWCEEHGSLSTVKHKTEIDGFRLGAWLNTRRQDKRHDRLSEDRIVALDELGIVWDPFDDRWEAGLAVCLAWRVEHGSLATVRQDAVFNGFNLGWWLSQKRQDRKKNRLSEDRIAVLDGLGFVWVDEWWEEGLAACRAWSEAHGSLATVAQNAVFEGFTLGWWLQSRRKEKKQGRLSDDRIDALEELGIVWDRIGTRWEASLAVCRGWCEENGSLATVTFETVFDEFNLGSWLNHRCQEKKHGRLSDSKIAALDELGIVWDRKERGWEAGLVACRAWCEEHGSLANVENDFVFGGVRLESWLTKRRQAKKQGQLPEDRVAALDELGIVWGPHDDRWEAALAVCLAWCEGHGSLANVRQDDVFDGFNLGDWVVARRQDKKKHRLSQEKITALDELGMVWDRIDAQWEAGMGACRGWCEEHGSLATVKAQTVVNGFNLGMWVTNRRQDKRKDRLSKDRIAALDDLGMRWSGRT
jgi:superfamily II DNA or RNA helicase